MQCRKKPEIWREHTKEDTFQSPKEWVDWRSKMDPGLTVADSGTLNFVKWYYPLLPNPVPAS
jgi:hypothetical protein